MALLMDLVVLPPPQHDFTGEQQEPRLFTLAA